VCAGIAEKTRVPVALIRLAFLALLFAKLFGIVLYLVLDMLMEVHTDDRASLLRFRIRRWWSSRFGAGEAAGV
jgi:phage shock protein PspC (stress-responsive transcriptional regulator)